MGAGSGRGPDRAVLGIRNGMGLSILGEKLSEHIGLRAITLEDLSRCPPVYTEATRVAFHCASIQIICAPSPGNRTRLR